MVARKTPDLKERFRILLCSLRNKYIKHSALGYIIKMEFPNLLDPKYQIIFKICGLVALLMSAYAYGEYKYISGQLDQCLEHDGYLLYGYHGINENLCVNASVLRSEGWEIDKESRRIYKNTYPKVLEDQQWLLNISS